MTVLPIQVKQMDQAGGLATIDAFEAVIEREGEGGRDSTELAEVQRGFFVSFGYTKDAEHECAAFHGSTELAEVKRTGRIIKLLTGLKILDEEHVQKMCLHM